MAWNTQESGGKKEAPKKAKLGRWLATTGLMIAVVAGVAVYFLNHPVTPKADKQEKSRAKIAEAQADLSDAPEVEEAQPVEPPKTRQFWEVDAAETNDFTEAQMRKWTAMHLPPAGYTNNTSLTEAPPEYAIFNTAAENEIACLLTLDPGETIVDIPTYSEQFKREFYEGLREPIEFADEDTEEQRELKTMMIEARNELKRQIDAGGDLGEILAETRQELIDLARYKSMLSFQLGEIQNDRTMTDQDLEDFVNAANEMLESKGIAPMELGFLAKQRLKRLAEEKRREVQ